MCTFEQSGVLSLFMILGALFINSPLSKVVGHGVLCLISTQIMGRAFERACKALHDVGQPAMVKDVIAKRITDIAKTGERDPHQLCERALMALGLPPQRV